MNLRKMEGKSMRTLNRVIVAGALVVPMGLGVSGIAVANVPADSSVLPTQIAASEDDHSDACKKNGGLLGLLGLLSKSKGSCNGDEDGGDGGKDASGPLG
jgi:hypothetical protein